MTVFLPSSSTARDRLPLALCQLAYKRNRVLGFLCYSSQPSAIHPSTTIIVSSFCEEKVSSPSSISFSPLQLYSPAFSLSHSLSAQAVTSYFSQANPNALPYGFVPEIAALKTANTGATGANAGSTTTKKAKTAAPSLAPADPAPASSPAATDESAEPGVGTDQGLRAGGEAATKETGVAGESAGKDESATQEGRAYNPMVLTSPPQQQEQELLLTEVESEEDVEAFLTRAADRLVLVDFGAEWCKNCKGMLVGESMYRRGA